MSGDGLPSRRHQIVAVPDRGADSYDKRACASVVLAAALPLSYAPANGGFAFKGVVATDAAFNGATDPAEAQVVRCAKEGGRLSHVALAVVCTQDTVIQPWVRTGLTGEGEPKWVRLGPALSFSAARSPEEKPVLEVGFRDFYPQVVSGADADHPVGIFGATF